MNGHEHTAMVMALASESQYQPFAQGLILGCYPIGVIFNPELPQVLALFRLLIRPIVLAQPYQKDYHQTCN